MAELQPRVDRGTLRRWLTQSGDIHQWLTEYSTSHSSRRSRQGVNIYYHADSSITDVAQLPVEYQFAP